MKQSRMVAWGGIGAVGMMVALAAGPVVGQSGDTALPVHDFTDLNKAWNLATDSGNPLPLEWITFASTALQKPQETGKSSGGVVLIGRPSTTTAPVATPVVAFPIVSLPAGDAQEAHRRNMGLQLFLTAVSRFQPTVAPAGSVTSEAKTALIQSLPGWTRAAHLELLVTEAIFFLSAAAKHDKCLHLERLQEHAAYLGWKAVSQSAATASTQALSLLPAAWSSLESSTRTFYDANIAGQPVLETICELSPSVSNAEVESEVKSLIEQRIVARFEELAAEIGSALDGPLSELVKLEEQSAVNVPTKELFELERTVTDTQTLVDYVKNDASGLEIRDPAWRAQAVKAERTAKTEIQNQVAGMEHLEAARAELTAAIEELRAIASKLSEVGALPTVASELTACRQLTVSSDPTPAENEALIRGFDQCLGAIGDAYVRLRNQLDQDPRAPAFRGFAAKVSGLSQKIADVYHLQTPSAG